MVPKSRCYWYCAAGLLVGIVGGAVAAALIGIPRIGKLKR